MSCAYSMMKLSVKLHLCRCHVYDAVWKPVKHETIGFKHEEENKFDKHAVAGMNVTV